jgi:hypothetical protein
MDKDDTLYRLEMAAEDMASINGAAIGWFEQPNGEWVVSMEPTGERTGDWSVTADGPTRAKALSNLIAEAKDVGRA